VQPQPLPNQPDGSLALADIDAAIKPDDEHFARSRLPALENTIGGKVLPMAYLAQAMALARRHGLAAHLDGARLFNAAVALGGDPRANAAAIAGHFDSVSVCFSKGLGAPVGSALVGSKELVKRAHRWRKMLGGGMRQAGILAAAGLYALEHHVERLADDHRHARRLADGLRGLGLTVAAAPETNILLFGGTDIGRLGAALRTRQVLINPVDRQTLRAVTHLDVTAEDIDDVLGRVGEALLGGNA
jgi:threonine aldolase